MAGTDPIHQFVIQDMFPIHLGGDGTAGSGLNFSFTNSSLFMVATVAVISLYLIMTTSAKSVVPGRAQLVSELLYGFVANMVRSAAGTAGMTFFPLVFSLFIFILLANLIGMLPFAFTVTSHISVTFALAMLVFCTVTIYGLVKHGFGFLRLFLPSGVPIVLAPIIVLIEVVSYISRPISHSIRLFAVMLAGHIALKVFAGFVVGMTGLGAVGILGAVLPLIMTVALTGLEVLMAILQAYIFTMLTCMYLNDALHPSH